MNSSPSSIPTNQTAGTATAQFPDPATYSLSNVSSSKTNGGQRGGSGDSSDPKLGDDYSWLDGFGMGAPMAQFPVVGPQTVPMLFGGGSGRGSANSNGSGNAPPNQASSIADNVALAQGLGVNINDIFGGADGIGRYLGSNGNLSGYSGGNDGTGTLGGGRSANQGSGMMDSDRLPPGMFGATPANDALPSSMFGFATGNSDSLPNYGTGDHLSVLFPPQQGSNMQSMPSPPTASNPNPQNSWFFSNFSSEEPLSTFDMNMNVDAMDITSGVPGGQQVEPALNDASWQEYMRQVFVSGGNAGNQNFMGF